MRKIALLLALALAAPLGHAADPYWPELKSPKLVTPQWIGEEGVEAVVILSIDDMTDPAKYERFLRPILDRLKKIDGRAPVSIFTMGVDPTDPQLQEMLKEGLSIESHTMDHPCPLLAGGDFDRAKSTVDRNIDLLHAIPNMKPVAYRMPCCDSMNSVSPRFFAEILHKETEAGNFLVADSSVFNVFTPEDPDLPKELIAPDGEEKGRFEKYVPRKRGFVNLIENYPYPYTIRDRYFADRSWQFPGCVPSDWEAQNLHGSKNPKTVEDIKAAIDCTVIKQGVFTLVFHPHGWIENTQVVDIIDHVVATHGKKVKFLNLREAVERLDKHALGGRSLRRSGAQNQVRLEDLDRDGLMDVVLKSEQKVRIWNKEKARWEESARQIVDPAVDTFGFPSLNADVNGDGVLDSIYSSAKEFSVSLSLPGTSKRLYHAKRGEREPSHEIPIIVRKDGTINGAWVKDGWMYVQNEDTGGLPGQVEKRKLSDLLKLLPAKNDLPNIKPKTPEESLQSMQTRPELEVQLVAAEPEVRDPVDIAWGPDGKLWVVEMADYPNGMDGKGKPGGRVRFLEDEDGDGRYEKSTLFLEGLNFPTGVLPWRGGVLVTAAPEILWAVDTDGDGVADEKEVLYDGFKPGNPQHRVNGLRWGLDNWIHIANGDSGGVIRSIKTGETLDIGGRDLRIRPDEGEMEAQSGRTQFGRVRDDFGNWFGNNNSNALWHYVLRDHYLRRNPHVASPGVLHMVPEESGRLQLYPISTTVERFNDFHTADKITSACGTAIYRDTWLGEEFHGNAFICEPVHNLVTRQVLTPRGLSFASRRAAGEESREFLASSDNWFRPVTAKTGPDGALYIVDMYRHVIEHPEWIPKLWQMRLNLRAGEDKGRIYRVVRREKKLRTVPRLDELKTAGLAEVLAARNGELRDMVHMEAVQREDAKDAATSSLRALAAEADLPEVRLQALCVLAGANGLTESDLLPRMKDESPEVRRQAVRLAEDLSVTPELVSWLETLRADPDPRVRHQLYSSLGNLEGAGVDDFISEVLLEWDEPEQAEWFLAAIISSVRPEVAARVLSVSHARIPESLFGALQATAKGAGQRVKIDYVSGGAERRIGGPPKVIADQLRVHEAAAKLQGDPHRGRAVFGTHCAVCHRLVGAGNEVGPDLAALTDRSFSGLASAIIDPNAALEDKYEACSVTGRDGRELVGIVHSETSTSMVLKLADGSEETLLKAQVQEVQASGRSLMPEGFGVLLDSQQLADLVAYLQKTRPPAKRFEGNAPVLVRAGTDGSLVLPATVAAIYGPKLVFGNQHKILEFWGSEHDFAVWEIECGQAGSYKVEVELGCETGVENRLQVIAGGTKASAVVPQTKNWLDFQRVDCGSLELREGRQEIVVRSDGPVDQWLMDVRAVFLTPAK